MSRLKRTTLAELPAHDVDGELIYVTDGAELYVGTGNATPLLPISLSGANLTGQIQLAQLPSPLDAGTF